MLEWEMYCNYFLTIASVFFLMVAAWYITRRFFGDFDEDEAVKNAEWIISEHCNDSKGCKDCDKFLREKGCCRYQYYTPWQWEKRD